MPINKANWLADYKKGTADNSAKLVRNYTETPGKLAAATSADAQKNFGQGRVLHAKAAVEAGLADGIRSLEDIVARIGSGHLTVASMGSQASMDAAFEESLDWYERNATERARLTGTCRVWDNYGFDSERVVYRAEREPRKESR